MCTSTSNSLTIGSDLALKTHNSRRKSRTLTISSHPREVKPAPDFTRAANPRQRRGVVGRRSTRPALSPSTRGGVTRRRMLLLLLRNTCDDDDSDDEAMLVPRHNPTTKLRFGDPPPTLLLPKQIAPSPYTQGTIYKSGRVHAHRHLSNRETTKPTTQQSPQNASPSSNQRHPRLSPRWAPPISLSLSHFHRHTKTPHPSFPKSPRAMQAFI